MKEKYLAYEFKSGLNTTQQINSLPACRWPIAGRLKIFSTTADRDIWVNKCSDKIRKAVTKIEAKKILRHLTIDEFNFYLDNLEYDWEEINTNTYQSIEI